jgi:hypothetical protein
MNKVLIVASNTRSYLDLKNVVLEFEKRNHPYFFLYTLDSKETFYDSNIDKGQSCTLQSIRLTLPFKPDILMVARESWEPETTIIRECKQLGCIITCIENTSWLVGTIKSRLEMLSRKRYPTNCIDIFFENSEWSLETKKMCGWYDFKSVIVGNPKYDDFNIISSGDEGILVFGTHEKESQSRIYNLLDELTSKTDTIYYKPHPEEHINHQFNPKINIISTQEEIPSIAAKTEIHLSNISISTYWSVLLNKKFISIDEYIGRNSDLDLEFFKGKEYNFWAPIINCNSWEEFIDKVGLDRISLLRSRYEDLKSKCIQYNSTLDINKISKYKLNSDIFDQFGDNKASKRIVNYIERL